MRAVMTNILPSGPFPATIDISAWARLSPSRKARLTGVAGDLRGVSLSVFIVMAEHAGAAGSRCTASVSTIAGEAGFAVSPVRRAIRRLELDCWIRCVRRSRGGLVARDRLAPTSAYRVLVLPEPPSIPLTKARRLSALFPERRLERFRAREREPA